MKEQSSARDKQNARDTIVASIFFMPIIFALSVGYKIGREMGSAIF